MDRLVVAVLVAVSGVFAGIGSYVIVSAAQDFKAEVGIRARLHAGCIAEATAQYSAVINADKIQLFCDNAVYGGGK
jgi:hypothetical protein